MDIKEFENMWINSHSIIDDGYLIVHIKGDIRIYCDNYSIERLNIVYFYRNHRLIGIANLDDIVTIL